MASRPSIAPSTSPPLRFGGRALEAREPDRASARATADAALHIEIARVWEASRQRYGARKIWHARRREGVDVARCTVERLMKAMGIEGVVRGRQIVTTNPDAARPCPDDPPARTTPLPGRKGQPHVRGRAAQPTPPGSPDPVAFGNRIIRLLTDDG